MTTREQVDLMVSVAWQYGKADAYDRAVRYLKEGDLVSAALAAFHAVAACQPNPEQVFLSQGVSLTLEL